jgi:hypothetical protein
MPNGNPGGALQKAARVLAAADGVAHVAFFSLFVWRVVSGSGFRLVQGTFALLAILGFIATTAGSLLVKHGGKTKAGRLGVWLIATSTALAGLLLVVASWTGD